MRIIVDGDSCAVKDIILEVSQDYNIEVVFFTSINHITNYGKRAKVFYVDSYSQAVDIKIVNYMKKGDIIVTNDYGLASLVIGNGNYCISNRGQIFDKENIDRFLLNRHINMHEKKKGQRIKGPRKRHNDDDEKFRQGLIKLIKNKQ